MDPPSHTLSPPQRCSQVPPSSEEILLLLLSGHMRPKQLILVFSGLKPVSKPNIRGGSGLDLLELHPRVQGLI